MVGKARPFQTNLTSGLRVHNAGNIDAPRELWEHQSKSGMYTDFHTLLNE